MNSPAKGTPTDGQCDWTHKHHSHADGIETLRVLDINREDSGIIIERRIWIRENAEDTWAFDERMEWHLEPAEAASLLSGLQALGITPAQESDAPEPGTSPSSSP